MRKAILICCALLMISASNVSAQTEIPISPSPSPVEEEVNYALPFPGILPGTPLYSLKAARDRIIDFFITDPLKKSNYYLLQADKRLASAISLFGEGKHELGETTLSKGQNYLEKSLAKAIEAEKRQLEIGEVLSKIEQSSKKHTQEIENLIKVSSGETKEKLEADLKRSEKLEKDVTSARQQRQAD